MSSPKPLQKRASEKTEVAFIGATASGWELYGTCVLRTVFLRFSVYANGFSTNHKYRFIVFCLEICLNKKYKSIKI